MQERVNELMIFQYHYQRLTQITITELHKQCIARES